jgi:nitrate ABC transporter ATP-binding subunit
MSLLEISRLSKTFPGRTGPSVIVKDFNLRVEEGEFVCIVGHSGCGKSTVLSMLAGLTPPTAGDIVLGGKEVVGPGLDRGVVFQAPCLLPWLTALDNVLLAVREGWTRKSRADQVRLARRYLDLIGLGDSCSKLPDQLSAGMRQRVGIARAFATRPRLLLLDEPFGMLDSLTRWELQQVLQEMCLRDRRTAVMVTHDVDEALLLSDRIVLMTSGPAARVGEVVHVPFARPREKQLILEHPDYYGLRERLIGFLESEAARTAEREVGSVA